MSIYHCESPLDYWTIKSTDYSTLASLDRQVFSVPATSAPVGRVFSPAGKILKSTTMSHDSKELWNIAIVEDERPVYVINAIVIVIVIVIVMAFK